MLFEWDKAKNQANLQKHGLSLEEASQIFFGPVLTCEDRRIDYGEVRLVGMGALGNLVIVVIYTNRGNAIRLISARAANRKERERYHEYRQKNDQ